MSLLIRITLTVSMACFALTAIATPPIDVHMVKDLNLRPDEESGSVPDGMRVVGNRMFFSAYTPSTGRELFVTDGIDPQPQLFRDFLPGGMSSDPVALGGLDGKLIVAARNTPESSDLWAVPLSGGKAMRLASLSSNSRFNSVIKGAPVVNGRLLIAESVERSLWATDGSVAGTGRLSSLNAYVGIADTICSLGAVAVTTATGPGNTLQIWRTDGTNAGTSMLADTGLAFVEVKGTVEDNGRCFFLLHSNSAGWSLWRSDGSVPTTRRVVQGAGRPEPLVAMNSNLYFFQDSSQTGAVLWRSNGDDATLTAVGYFWSIFNPPHLTVVGSRLGFIARNSSSSEQFFVSDGTAVGTRATVAPTSFYASSPVAVLGGRFLVHSNFQSWFVDPITLSSESLGSANYFTGVFGSGPFVVLNGIGLGTIHDTRGYELWRSDGTVAGSGFFQDIWNATASGLLPPEDFAPTAAAVGDTLVFRSVALSGPFLTTAYGLGRTDGTAAGTWNLPADQFPEGSVDSIVPVGDGVAFSVTRRDYDQPLVTHYRADPDLQNMTALAMSKWQQTLQEVGSATGALLSCDVGEAVDGLCAIRGDAGRPRTLFPQVPYATEVISIGAVDDVAIFLRGTELWRSDGTLPGTFKIGEGITLNQPPFDGLRTRSVRLGQKLIIAVYQGLIATDGTPAGTVSLRRIPQGDVDTLAVLGDRFLFVLTYSGLRQLWIGDGTATGNELLYEIPYGFAHQLASTGDAAHLMLPCILSCDADKYLVTRGTKGDIREVALPPGIKLATGLMMPLGDNTMVFSCGSDVTGVELCATDSDAAEASFLKDIYPGPGRSSATYVGRTSDANYFSADDGFHGRELWTISVLPETIFNDGFQ